MALLDFLFNGSPPPQVSSYSSSSTNFPDWYSAYSQGLLSKANAIAGESYQPYSGPRVAGFTPDQNAAFNAVQAQQGAQNPISDAAVRYTDAGGQTSSMGAAQPYFSQAAQTLPQGIGDYMSPYTSAVTDRIAQLGGRNLSENLLPQVNDTFTGLGQFGSSRHADFTNRAVRDVNESVLGEQAKALESGYNMAGQQFQADQARLGGLGQAAGALTGSDASRLLQAGQQQGALAQQRQAMGYQDAAALEAVGQTQQGQQQKNLDTAYQDFLEQRNYPRTGIDLMNQALRGVTPPTTTTTSGTGPGSTFQPSPLAQLAGAGLTYAGLQRAGLFKRGGRVRYGGLRMMRRA